VIYHILTESEWAMAQNNGKYEPESLEKEGFIHCCTEEHFEHMANFYFSGAKKLIALEIDPEKLKVHVKFEGDADIKHPHVYGPINLDAIIKDVRLESDDEGLFHFPFKPVLH
jgi:uncharacterized protein (DUF952 family)